MDPFLEIGDLPSNTIDRLAQILDPNEFWKKLMVNIPKQVFRDTEKCDVDLNNPILYKSRHYKIVEELAPRFNGSCTATLLNDWSSCGRVRPTVANLLYLLTKSELFKAADYVAEELLGRAKPPRPDSGPAATIQLTSDEQLTFKSENTLNANLEHSEPTKNVPKIIISNFPDESEVASSATYSEIEANVPLFHALAASDTITDNNTDNVPNLSELLGGDSSSGSNDNVPAFDQLMDSSDNSTSVTGTTSFSKETSASYNTPNLKLVLSKTPSSSSVRSCGSPLPNLSLNTTLPHFAYSELALATNNFDEGPANGRFLGSGAFGKVYLALGLLQQPVAVKKILLGENVDVVHLDDSVTIQFRKEVEILSKYKHDNLLSLLGYSCDGCTYCLIYEYIVGGSLQDKLQASTDKLSCDDRLSIAFGTAKAVVHLHTALSSPLLHRDIKSANILLDETNEPKLCDFGLIKLVSPHYPNGEETTRTQVVGTRAYMSPEVYRGDFSVKQDTFSFGVVLLELLTSLAPMDHEREEGYDLVTYVEDKCDDVGIAPLLDLSVGSWQSRGVNFGEELYEIALRCLIDKKKDRPDMVEINNLLEELRGKLV